MVDALEARLERAIQDGVFAAGGLLPGENRFAQELGVSRPTLRNALSRLISRGILEASQGRQTRVSELGQLVTLDALVLTVLAHPPCRRVPEASCGSLGGTPPALCRGVGACM
jgi:GntR family transcriptional repressor for pyruvate dehydrogenase complex